MAETIVRRVPVGGVLSDKTYTLSSTTPVASQDALEDICLDEFTSLGMTNDNLPGNATLAGIASKIAQEAQTQGILV
jgi:hypothetical protein